MERLSAAEDCTVGASGVFQLCLQRVVVGMEVVKVIQNEANVWVGDARRYRSGICRVPLGRGIFPYSPKKMSALGPQVIRFGLPSWNNFAFDGCLPVLHVRCMRPRGLDEEKAEV